MVVDKGVHVLGLTAREQFMVKLVLANLLSSYLDKSMQEAAGVSSEVAEAKAAQTLNLFNKYNDFVDLMCPQSMLAYGKNKLILVKPQMMRYLVIAFNGYDARNNYLGTEHNTTLRGSFDALKKKVMESNSYTFNAAEIERAKKP